MLLGESKDAFIILVIYQILITKFYSWLGIPSIPLKLCVFGKKIQIWKLFFTSNNIQHPVYLTPVRIPTVGRTFLPVASGWYLYSILFCLYSVSKIWCAENKYISN